MIGFGSGSMNGSNLCHFWVLKPWEPASGSPLLFFPICFDTSKVQGIGASLAYFWVLEWKAEGSSLTYGWTWTWERNKLFCSCKARRCGCCLLIQQPPLPDVFFKDKLLFLVTTPPLSWLSNCLCLSDRVLPVSPVEQLPCTYWACI